LGITIFASWITRRTPAQRATGCIYFPGNGIANMHENEQSQGADSKFADYLFFQTKRINSGVLLYLCDTQPDFQTSSNFNTA